MKKEKWHRIEGPEIDIHLGLYAVQNQISSMIKMLPQSSVERELAQYMAWEELGCPVETNRPIPYIRISSKQIKQT